MRINSRDISVDTGKNSILMECDGFANAKTSLWNNNLLIGIKDMLNFFSIVRFVITQGMAYFSENNSIVVFKERQLFNAVSANQIRRWFRNIAVNGCDTRFSYDAINNRKAGKIVIL